MTLRTPKKSVDERDVFTPNSIRVISTISPSTTARSSKKLLLACCILGAFAGGFALSFVSRPRPPFTEARIQVSDFQVAIPEGETTVTIKGDGLGGRIALEPLGALEFKGKTVPVDTFAVMVDAKS